MVEEALKELFSLGECKFKAGMMQVQVDKPFYNPGDMVQGQVDFRLNMHVEV